MSQAIAYDVVVPTLGRPSLRRLLVALERQRVPPHRVVLVDDRGDRTDGPLIERRGRGALRIEVLTGRGAGPAAARNDGCRAADCAWICLLDDDVVPHAEWSEDLQRDLASTPPSVVATQGRIRVPLRADRRPTDWERNVRGLETATWATADLAVRREPLVSIGGFDERFPRAYREDADLALRLMEAGWTLATGTRWIDHPVRRERPLVSLRLQRGNADDVRMRARHGPDWRERAQAPPGRFRRHAETTAAGAVALGALLGGHRRAATVAGAAWTAWTLRFAWERIAPGPRDVREVATMLLTSALIPPLAVAHRLRGVVDYLRDPLVWLGPDDEGLGGTRTTADTDSAPGSDIGVEAVLFDRDGTLVVDVPYNGDPNLVRPVPGARDALERLRRHGVRIGVVTNQSGIARGAIGAEDVERVNRRIDAELGPFDAWLVCPHDDGDGCGCRKPAPGMVVEAARRLGVRPTACVVVGDTGADVAAGVRAGARAILVPNGVTRTEEVRAAPIVASNLDEAVDLILDGR